MNFYRGGLTCSLKQVRNIRFFSSQSPVIAVRREDNVEWERRAPLAPSHIRKLVNSGVKVLIQPANKRAIPVQEYAAVGAKIQEDISEATVIFGVKQVPIHSLLPNKTYVFFSHTIKAQVENMPMLDAILEKKIRLIDYEKMERSDGKRVVAFGQYAGYAGMIDILHGMGLRFLALGHHTPFMHIGIAHNYRTSGQALQAVRDTGYEISLGRMPQSIGPLTFLFTGIGNVSQGAQEVFRELPHTYVEPHELKNVAEHGDPRCVYGCVVDMHHHLRRKTDGGFDMHEYFAEPHKYESTFAQEIAPYASCIVNGIFWRPGDPRLLTTADALPLQDPLSAPKISPLVRLASSADTAGCPRLPHRLIAIADISADPGGSIEFMGECTSIDIPFMMYNASTDQVKKGFKDDGFLLCSIDNLPAQLPREATQFFGDQLFPFMHDIVHSDANNPYENIKHMTNEVKGAIIASNGKLTPKFEYIHEQRKQRDLSGALSAARTEKHKVLVLGSGFVSSTVIDYLTKHNDTAITIASDKSHEVDTMAKKFKHVNPIHLNVGQELERLAELVSGHDLVVSLLPYTIHKEVCEICIDRNKNFISSSYVSDAIAELHQRAEDAGVTIMMESGLDPGIDHMLAMECMDDIKNRGGEVSSFVSWCGGLPAPENSDNPLRYKFSWSPVGVLLVTLSPSRYLLDGEVIEHQAGGDTYRQPPKEIDFLPGLNLVGLPNRDSIVYGERYDIKSSKTLLRGTLRYKGFTDVIIGLQQLNLISTEENDWLLPSAPPISWKDFIAQNLGEMKESISNDALHALIFDTVDQEVNRYKAIIGLGLVSEEQVPKVGTPLAALAEVLSAKLAYESSERDMIIMRTEIEGTMPGQAENEKHAINLVVYGDPDGFSAMSKTVGYPCAIAARMILKNKITDKGIVTPLKKHIYSPILKELRSIGIKDKSKVTFVR